MMGTKSPRFKATVAADSAFVKARNERAARIGEDGPIAIVRACVAYDKVLMRKIKAIAKRRGNVFEEFAKEVHAELGAAPPDKSGW